MQIPISTKLENAWYVDPELMAGDEEPEADPWAVSIEGDSEPRPNETMQLGEADLEEACAIAAGITVDDTARHYRGVSLRGALLAVEEDLKPGRTWAQGMVARVRAGLARRLEAPKGPPPPPLSLQARADRVAKQAVKIIEHLEQGRVPPVRLAVISFSAGVATTLVGVLLAL